MRPSNAPPPNTWCVSVGVFFPNQSINTRRGFHTPPNLLRMRIRKEAGLGVEWKGMGEACPGISYSGGERRRKRVGFPRCVFRTFRLFICACVGLCPLSGSPECLRAAALLEVGPGSVFLLLNKNWSIANLLLRFILAVIFVDWF